MWKIKTAVLVSLFSSLAHAACETAASLDIFVSCVQLSDGVSKNAPGKQAEVPSLATNSTTLVDQSSAGDLLTAAFNLTGLNRAASQGKGIVVSASAYSVYAAVTHQDPLNPYVYSRNAAWRRISFSLGSDVPDDPAKQDSARGDIYGVKALLSSTREPSQIGLGLESVLGAAAINDSRPWRKELEDLLYGFSCGCNGATATPAEKAKFINDHLTLDNWQGFYMTLLDEQKKEVTAKIAANAAPALLLTSTIQAAVQKLRNAPQWSLEALTKKRGDVGGNDYRLQMIYDRGLFAKTMLVANAGFDYKDFKKIGADTRGGRAAVEFRTAIAGDNPLRSAPLTVAVSGEGKWMTGSKPVYRAQVKLGIALGGPGLELPISFTYATQKDLIQETDVRGQIGFTIDPAKLLSLIKK